MEVSKLMFLKDFLGFSLFYQSESRRRIAEAWARIQAAQVSRSETFPGDEGDPDGSGK